MAPGDRQAFNDFLQRAFASGTGQSCEITLSGPGAEPVVVRVEGARSADGQECRIVLVDITEGRQAMAGVRASEAALSGIFNLAAVGIAQADPQTGRWLRVNRKMCEITGYSEGELLQMRIVEITHPDDWSRDLEEFQRVVRGEAPSYRLEKRYLRADGAVIWVNVNMMVIRDASGQPERTVATIEDITERKAAEAQAHLQTSRLGLALDAAEMVTWELDLATGRLSYSDNLLRMSGRVDAAPYVTLDAFVQQLHPDDQARATAALERAVQAGEPFECDYRVRVADGSWHWLLGKGKGVAGPDGQVVQVLGVSFDITARRLAEEQAQRWQRVFDNAEFGLAYANVADNTLLEVNGAFARQRGYTQAEMVGAPIGPVLRAGGPRGDAAADSGH
jgi:PAS domain S-box-containing protein